MANTSYRRRVQILLLVVSVVVTFPLQVLAQTLPPEIERELGQSDEDIHAPVDPGQDPFALTPEKLQMFQGFMINEDLNSLFTGEFMKNNGLFTSPTWQLGGASPNLLISPVVDNEEDVDRGGPTYIIITSRYSAEGELTMDSEITMTVTLRNAGENLAEGVTFYACLQDDYITLLEEPAPEPPFTNDPLAEIEESDEDTGPPPEVPIEPETPDALPDDEESEEDAEPPVSGIQDPTVNDCFMRLEWDSIDGEPIDLEPGEEVTFSWTFTPNSNDIIVRWRMVAEFGAGASYLRHWVPIKNPNPTGAGSVQGPGVPSFCNESGTTEPFPEAATTEEIAAAFKTKWNIEIISRDYDWGAPQHRPFLKGFWEAISALECSSFIENVLKDGPLQLIASSRPDWWGFQSDANVIEYNLPNMVRDGAATGAPVQFHQFATHELGHVFMSKNYDVFTEFENSICYLAEPYPGVSTYGSTSCTEGFAEAIGYYAFRQSKEQGVGVERCPAKNPYDWGWASYYAFMKDNVFGGKEFGSPPPNPPTSC